MKIFLIVVLVMGGIIREVCNDVQNWLCEAKKNAHRALGDVRSPELRHFYLPKSV